jgi:hypothetical protein
MFLHGIDSVGRCGILDLVQPFCSFLSAAAHGPSQLKSMSKILTLSVAGQAVPQSSRRSFFWIFSATQSHISYFDR